MAVALSLARIADQPALRTMLTAYLEELSAFDDGVTTDYPYFEAYWREGEARWPYLIRADAAVAGFALVCALDDDRSRFSIAEFYVRPEARRSGAGLAAALALFETHPGAWALSILHQNEPAHAFWGMVIAAAGGRNVERSADEDFVTYRFEVD